MSNSLTVVFPKSLSAAPAAKSLSSLSHMKVIMEEINIKVIMIRIT